MIEVSGRTKISGRSEEIFVDREQNLRGAAAAVLNTRQQAALPTIGPMMVLKEPEPKGYSI